MSPEERQLSTTRCAVSVARAHADIRLRAVDEEARLVGSPEGTLGGGATGPGALVTKDDGLLRGKVAEDGVEGLALGAALENGRDVVGAREEHVVSAGVRGLERRATRGARGGGRRKRVNDCRCSQLRIHPDRDRHALVEMMRLVSRRRWIA